MNKMKNLIKLLCNKYQRDFIGIEINKEYFDIASNKLKQ